MAKVNYILVAPLTYTGKAVEGFTYASDEALEPGRVVEIPLGRKKSLGVVIDAVAKPTFATKTVLRVLDTPPLPAHLAPLAQWVSQYYATSPASVWQAVLPRGVFKKRRASKPTGTKFKVKISDEPLTTEQCQAIDTVNSGKHAGYLIQGVTGSGKTRIYIELAKQSLAAGKSVIVLVPEIALTPQIVAHFEAAFGPVVISTHSRLTEAQRHKTWEQALTSPEPRIVIGPRSNLFMPLQNIGLVVVDECHETSYKQEQNPRYWAPSVAGQLAKLTGAKLVMGSATPGLWEYYLAKEGRIGHIKLTERVSGRSMPVADIVDLRDKDLLRHSKWLSTPLIAALRSTLDARRQSLLFLNRRGSATSQVCGDCGEVNLCPRCQLPLTFHADQLKLVCHFCNYQTTPPATCPHCNSSGMVYLGGGTKRIETEVKRLLPSARIARLDKDSFTVEYLQEIYKGLTEGTIDILIGTQMIAKGLDLPMIDTVGVVSADTMLNFPDYSATERTFQLLLQVSGRAGRGDRSGQVIIQTHNPDHPAIVAAAAHDFELFANAELKHRQALSYPPFRYIMKLTGAYKDQKTAITKSQELVHTLATNYPPPSTVIVGPAPALHELERGKCHWQIIVKAAKRSQLVALAATLPSQWGCDLDPTNLL